MSDRLPMSVQMTLLATDSATSSPASGSGATPCAGLDGPTTGKHGRAPAPAKRIPAPPGAVTLSLTGGLYGSPSSLQDGLERCLASRLPLPVVGLLASAMTWKPWDMPSGRPISRLSVSARTIYALGFTLRATPTATANQACPSMQKHPGCRGLEVSPEEFCRRMGLPPEWLSCAPSGTRSTASLQPSSLEPA
jgi:hypothetical protein